MADSAASRAADRLRAAVLEGELRPGQRLDEAGLVTRLQVSRNTLREAFRLLGHEHVVEHRPNRGVFVRRLSLEEARQLYQTRRLLEVGAVREAAVTRGGVPTMDPGSRRAAERRWSMAVTQVEEAAEEGREAARRGDYEAVGTANGRFHLALAALAGNEVLDRTLRTILTEMRLLFVVVADPRSVHGRYVEANARIADLVAAGEVVRAAVALEEYLLGSEAHLLEVYASHFSES
ncbi:GntR family transcriptional regulator [Oryzihumus leptocrescens]|uniref:GntR family transcriptional regulator n=1 Tax=Oryzihumus leptocrescens TaxID=297536 RepID=A0A542ZL08_9MICO|nr:GntR family transcriptional regulator [Oryzihumus leptocrescens]TQL61042.1 GntR family transcriptional regulator [Oryzihumus leptocrescens]